MYDAVLILGGGVSDEGKLYPWVAARFDLALTHDKETHLYIPLSRGTAYKQTPFIESEVGKQYLMNQGISSDRILTETTSLDTIGNAFFARTQFSDPHHLYQLHVITSQFHLPRTKTIFDWIYGLSPRLPYQLTYESSSDTTMPAAVLSARLLKERQGVHALDALTSSISSLATCHEWLFTQHAAYNQAGPIAPLDPLVADSY